MYRILTSQRNGEGNWVDASPAEHDRSFPCKVEAAYTLQQNYGHGKVVTLEGELEMVV